MKRGSSQPNPPYSGKAELPEPVIFTLCAIDFREFKRNIFLVINHSIVWREIYEK